ncbi:hypothetical protein [Deefgea sp. CFH1-16]|uniref:hypothetical protein n=1 Tax=Deefgea sp. CFH1-16 TaxID=2675457 RepID=UPI0015F493BF|nr:hypothetical protein [Deefgea sp. CFH1-16]MBM5575100.1 hypothetical protein [Deefgea sp. CFH1-16]
MIFATANRKSGVIAAGKNPHLLDVNSGFSPAWSLQFSLRKIWPFLGRRSASFAFANAKHILEINAH